MKYLTILATALMLAGCASAPTTVETKQTAAVKPLSSKAEPKRRVNLSQAEILCNQSLLPGKEKYSYYCQFRKPPVAQVQSSPLDPNVTIPDPSKFAATPTQKTTRADIVTANRDEDDSGAAFFRKQSSYDQSGSFSLFGNGMQKPVTVAKNWEGKHAVRNRTELKQALNVDPLSVAWCAAFVNTILKQSGFQGTNSLQARSFLNYGSVTRHPEYGDIVVFARGRDQWSGHVGFYVGEEVVEGVRYILVLGGNQRKEVNVAYYPANYVLGYRKIG